MAPVVRGPGPPGSGRSIPSTPKVLPPDGSHGRGMGARSAAAQPRPGSPAAGPRGLPGRGGPGTVAIGGLPCAQARRADRPGGQAPAGPAVQTLGARRRDGAVAGRFTLTEQGRPADASAIVERSDDGWISRRVSTNGIICVAWQQISCGKHREGRRVDIHLDGPTPQIWTARNSSRPSFEPTRRRCARSTRRRRAERATMAHEVERIRRSHSVMHQPEPHSPTGVLCS
jgi:hypothetical protein